MSATPLLLETPPDDAGVPPVAMARHPLLPAFCGHGKSGRAPRAPIGMAGEKRKGSNASLRGVCRILFAGLAGLWSLATAEGAPNFSLVPGVVISYQASPSALDVIFGNDIYIADSDIVVLPNGDYIASHSYFGSGSTEDTAAITRVFRSTNQGANWTLLGQFQPLWRASLFVHGGALYLMGPEYNGGSYNTIRKSTNNGTTWTTPVDASTGRFESVPLSGTLGTPNNPLVFNNRLYGGGGGRSTFSTPLSTADPLLAGDWRVSGGVTTFSTWQVGLAGALGSAFIGEGQAVASPEQGVVVIGKVEGFPYAALMRAERSLGDMRFGSSNDFAAMPGAEKKFGAMYDSVTGKFYVLSNPILPFHAANASITPQLKRNTAAVLSSRDLFNWDVEKIFLYSANISYEGFQYLQFDFDGDDMVVASRTAFDVNDTNRPPRGHDSNLLTFHRIPDFRTHVRDHYLLADTANNQVLRYEVTQHADAPLGKFTLGTTFAGAALTAPKDLAQNTNGDVYIRENGGRILRFDAMGNFVSTAASSPVPFSTPQLSIAQPPAGERSWVKSGSGNWGEPLNWYYWGRPDITAEIATFGSAATAATNVTVDAAPLIWSFNTTGDREGWTTQNITGGTVANGINTGVSSTTNPILNRVALSFPGSISPEARIRMKASGPGSSISFYWGNTTADSFQSARKITVPYTGAGAFQDIVIPMAGNPEWDGKIVTRIRFDLPNDSGATFEVDSIEIPKDSFRLKGLRFRSTPAYTISGGGSLRIEPDAGNGIIDVALGSHVIGVPLTLAADTDVNLATGATLGIAGAISGSGKGVNKSGAGTLTLSGINTFSGNTTVTNGTLNLAGSLSSPVYVAGGVFTGTGTVNSNLTVSAGLHAPGSSPGSMSVTNNYVLGAAGTLRIEINGTAPGTQYDQVKLTGASSTVNLAGALDIIAAPGLAAGGTFRIIDNTASTAAVSGAFAGLPQNTEFYEDAQWWRISYTGGTGNDFALTRLAPNAWQAWLLASFGSAVNDPLVAGYLADPNVDGERNLFEFATGQDPTVVSTAPGTLTRNGANLEFVYTRSLAAMGDGVTFTIEWSDTLATNSWSSSGVTEVMPPLSDNGVVQTVKVLVPSGPGAKRFVHLKVTKP